MSGHTATTLAYVRTSAGVVKVDPDGTVPDDVDETELQRLAGAGAIKVTPDKPAGGQSNGQGNGKAGKG